MFNHYSVMLHECIESLNIKPCGVYVDGTAGGGGHSLEIAKKLTTGKLFCFDKDPDAIDFLTEKFKDFENVYIIKSDFCEIKNKLLEHDVHFVDGILLDLGVSSHQLDTQKRGFSYSKDAFLDMRMEKEGLSAYDIINTYSEEDLINIFRNYGEEKFSSLIAKKIVKKRVECAIKTTLQLTEIIKSALPSKVLRKEKNPCRQVFQAIRIEVNSELDSLKKILFDGFDILKSGARFSIITFHSLEDRIVKKTFLDYANDCICPKDFPICVCNKKQLAKIINKKPIVASEEEIFGNKRSRSAHLRIIEKI